MCFFETKYFIPPYSMKKTLFQHGWVSRFRTFVFVLILILWCPYPFLTPLRFSSGIAPSEKPPLTLLAWYANILCFDEALCVLLPWNLAPLLGLLTVPISNMRPYFIYFQVLGSRAVVASDSQLCSFYLNCTNWAGVLHGTRNKVLLLLFLIALCYVIYMWTASSALHW